MEFALDNKGGASLQRKNLKGGKAKALIRQVVMNHMFFMVKRAALVREAWEALKNTFSTLCTSKTGSNRSNLTRPCTCYQRRTWKDTLEQLNNSQQARRRRRWS
jgi:hypothetical protein